MVTSSSWFSNAYRQEEKEKMFKSGSPVESSKRTPHLLQRGELLLHDSEGHTLFRELLLEPDQIHVLPDGDSAHSDDGHEVNEVFYL